MLYSSTRGGASGLTFREALLSSYTADGGLFLPDSIPSLDMATLRSWKCMSYTDLCKSLIPLFIAEEELPTAILLGKAARRTVSSRDSLFC